MVRCIVLKYGVGAIGWAQIETKGSAPPATKGVGL